jgi:murein DD-endopeptidase MepM/ murein hydrolase activator NlpD
MREGSTGRPTRLRLAAAVIALLLILCGALILGGVAVQPRLAAAAEQLLRLRTWFADPAANPEWTVLAGVRCQPDAPMLMPTAGYIGFGWDDSFRPGHRHSGYDIFTPDRAVNVTPVIAAYDGYLTREPGWRSAVIIRHPDFPAIVPGEQIWTYYTHMASADGSQSFIAPQFPAGTRELFVPAGTLLGYQGNWSGSAASPTGIHLHFSIVKSTPGGSYADETDIANTYDPAPFLGVMRNAAGVLVCARTNGP